MPTPKTFVLRALLVLLAASLPAGGASASSTQLLEKPVRVRADWPSVGPRDAFVGVRFELENLEPKEHRVRLLFDGAQAKVGRDVVLAAGERREVSLSLPAAARFGALRAIVEGAEKPGSEGFSLDVSRFRPLLLEGRETAAPLLAARQDPELWGEDAVVPLVVVEARELPSMLAELAGYPAVGLLETRFEALTQAQQRALEAYAATGGRLFLRELPEGLGEPEDGQERRRLGFGEVVACGASCAQQIAELPGVEEIERPTFALGDRSNEAVSVFGTPPLLDLARVPAGGFLTIVLLFTAVLGVGCVLVRRRFGPAALLAFVPATATVACLGIAGYGVAREGISTLHASARAVTLLDARRSQATTLAVEGFYATLSPRAARFGPLEAPLIAQELDGLVVEQDDGLSFVRGLIPSRSYRELAVLSVASTRARLTAREQAGKLVVENALGARVAAGIVGWQGRSCLFTGIEDGATGEASCGEHDVSALASPLEGRIRTEKLGGTALAPLADGEFVARLERAVFAPDGGLELKRRDDQQLVRGRVAP